MKKQKKIQKRKLKKEVKKVKRIKTVKPIKKSKPKKVKPVEDRMESPNIETQQKHEKQEATVRRKRTRKGAAAVHYVDPKELATRIENYYKCDNPDIKDDELASMIYKIANRLAFAPNFINYSFREEMTGDAIVKMLSALRNRKFKINQNYNPFSYFTKIAFNAFCNRIKKEKRSHEALTAYQEEVYDTLLTHGHVSNKNAEEQMDE